ncbi:MAG: DapH/DapD/GlmU-related protein [Acetobacteraceae bacterium]
MSPPRQVVLYGVGSPIVVDVEESCARAGWTVVSAVRNMDGPIHADPSVPVVPAAESGWRGFAVLLPLFSPANRRFAQREAAAAGTTDFPVLVDPTSILPHRIELGAGTYVNAGCVVGAVSRLGPFAFVNRGACLGHHLELGAFVSIGPGAVIAGQVTIGDDVLIGAGAVVLPKVTIGVGAVIGAGAVVRADVAANARVVGIYPS